MRKKLTRVVAVVLLVAVLAMVPGLVGCGEGGEKAGNKIIWGWPWDFTGRAAVGVTQLYVGITDYLKMTKEENPVPGVEVDLMTYDTRSEPARVVVGYNWLKDRGAALMSCAPQDYEILVSQAEADKMPFFIASTLLANLASEWCISEYGAPESQLEIVFDWIMDNWDVGTQGKCKIGFIGLAGVPFYEAQRDKVLEIINANPDKLELVGVEMAPTTTTQWASEIGKLKDSDYINGSMTGPPLASFLIEARQRGYDKGLVGPLETWMAFWGLVKGVVPEADLDGVICGFNSVWWTDGGGAFMDELKEHLEKYHSAAEIAEYHEGTGYLNGWAYGMMLIDSLRRAADKVGGENVTGMDVFNALKEMDLTVPGWKFPWKTAPNVPVLMRGVRLMQYKADVSDWVQIEDYVIPPSLGG